MGNKERRGDKYWKSEENQRDKEKEEKKRKRVLLNFTE